MLIALLFNFCFSWMAWLAVIIIQAIIHFGIIGPRNRRRKSTKAIAFSPETENVIASSETEGEEVDLAAGASRSAINELRSEINAIDVRLPILEGRKRSLTSSRDFNAAEEVARQIKELSTKRELTNAEFLIASSDVVFCPMNTISSSCVSPSPQNTAQGYTNEISNEYGTTCVSDLPQNILHENENSEHEQDERDTIDNLNNSQYSACDVDSYDDPDDEWRYELIKYYNSPSSPSMTQMNASEDSDDSSFPDNTGDPTTFNKLNDCTTEQYQMYHHETYDSCRQDLLKSRKLSGSGVPIDRMGASVNSEQ